MAGLCFLSHCHHSGWLRLPQVQLSDIPGDASHRSSLFKFKGLSRRNIMRSLNISCSNINTNNGGRTEQQSGTKRRQLLLQGVVIAAGFSLPVITTTTTNSVALGETDVPQDFRVYSDDVNKFKIMIPQDWQVGSGEGDGIKSLTAFYPQEASSSNVSIVITGLGADFTRLESFGKVDAFAENLVGGLDRSWQRPPGVAAKLVDCKAANGLYYIEYTLQNPGESRRHLFSVLGIANNGWYNRLYTLTGQFVEEEAEKYGSTIKKVFVGSIFCLGAANSALQIDIIRYTRV